MRLSKVARELNVSIDRLTEKLAAKGFEVEARPNTKITNEQYDVLNQAFKQDHTQKLKSEQVSKKKAQEKEAFKQARKSSDDTTPDKVATAETKKPASETQSEDINHDDEFNKLQKDFFEKEKEKEQKEVEKQKEDSKVQVAKADVKGIKTVGIIDLDNINKPKADSTTAKGSDASKPSHKQNKADIKAKEEPTKEQEPKETAPQPEVKKDDVVKAKGTTLKGVTSLGKINIKSKASAGKFNKTNSKDQDRIKKELAKKLTSVDKEKAAQKAKEAEKAAADQEKANEANKPAEVIKARAKTLSGPTFTGQKIDLNQFKKPAKKVASSSNPQGKKKNDANKKKRTRINKNPNATGGNNQGGNKRPGGNQNGPNRGPGNRNAAGGNRGGAGKGRFNKNAKGAPKVAKAEPTDAEIAKKISDTLNRLTNKGKSKSSKYRRNKRDERRGQAEKELEQQAKEKQLIKVTEFVTSQELATMMDVSITDVISSCMMLGLMVTMNQRLDKETLTIVASEFGFDVEFVSADVQEAISENEEVDSPEDLIERPPIVTVMGHVDHGKTSLLDYIRKANVIAGEAGGITQHIGSYSVELPNGKPITFIDTPGHEAFTAMRARGAQVTDVAIIVISAEDRIMPQTKEAIAHAQAAEVPIIFAINKVDKPNASPDKIKQELASANLLIEEWGGKYQSYDVSAKTGLNVESMLEGVLLEAELLELKANPNRKAKGSIVEASLDKGKGYTTNILVQTGTLNIGDFILTGKYFGKIKAMHNERGQNVDTAGPSTPVSILGLNGAPQAGDTFNVMADEREAKSIASKRMQLQREQSIRTQRRVTLGDLGRRIELGDFQELNIILKGDVDGSIEALSDSLQKLSTESIQVNILHKAVGQISDSDVLLATASDAIIIGFQVRPSGSARKIAEKEGVDLRLYSIIYDAINDVKEAMEGMLSPDFVEEVVANITIRETFRISKVGTIAGCYVTSGKINRSNDIRVIREGIVIYSGKLGSLKRFKDDVKEVAKGYECGLNIDKFNDLKVDDVIEAYEMVEVKKKL